MRFPFISTRTFLLIVTVTFSALTAHAQELLLYPGGPDGDFYTANDTTYQNGSIYVGQNSTFTLPLSTVATLNIVSGGNVLSASSYNTSTTNISGGSVSNALGNNISTTNISGGSVNSVVGLNTSTTNISGGSVNTVITYNTSTTNISSGSVNVSENPDNSIVNISGGSVGSNRSFGTSITNISGGSVNIAEGNNTSTVNISGGNVDLARGYNTSTINIIGGSIGEVFTFDDSIANIYGGTISQNTISAQNGGVVNLYGVGFVLSSAVGTGTDSYGDYTTYNLSGTLQNGYTLRTTFHDYLGGNEIGGATSPLVFNATAVAPEADTFALFLPALSVLGAFVVRRKR